MRIFNLAKLGLLLGLTWILPFDFALSEGVENLYGFKIENEILKMKDGVGVSVTYYIPQERFSGEKFPVLFEMQPYRKDDLFKRRDYSLNSYFAKRGFVMVKADVRGTGSSGGSFPDREYSEKEIQDAIGIIEILSKKQWSNGRVGMWGISWSGFNAIMVAMRNPPALKAILAVDASDDLYHDDVHYLDGAFHVDQYELSIENDLSLPASPGYVIDTKYFHERFERKPWFFSYKKNLKNGAFWQKNSLRGQYEKLKTPTFLIGGLLDGYRDSIPRMLDHVNAPIRALIGPWNHAWPDNGEPGPVVEWRAEMIRWWNLWLKDGDRQILAEPNFSMFLRAGGLPDKKQAFTQGKWVTTQWPLKTKNREFFLSEKFQLTGLREAGKSEIELKFQADAGRSSGFWWGEPTPDTSEDDKSSTTFDSEPLSEPFSMAGIARFDMSVSTNASPTSWVVQLEDVAPGGESALVTGSLINGTQFESSVNPKKLIASKNYKYSLPLHFTTYTFKKGHRVRLVVRNSNFPMIWPSPAVIKSRIRLHESSITLPDFSDQTSMNPAKYLSDPILPRDELPNSSELASEWPKEEGDYVDGKGVRHVTWKGTEKFSIDRQVHEIFENTDYAVNKWKPWESSFQGRAGHSVDIDGKRKIQVFTNIDVKSSQNFFEILFARTLFENGTIIRKKVWKEKFPREFH